MKDYLILHLKLMFSEKATKFKLLFLLQQWLWLALTTVVCILVRIQPF